jgi:Predicted metal-dependent protease of the PAD1/JAB1 superfamily
MLRLRLAVRDDLVAHAREGASDEVCGVLAGTHGGGGAQGDASTAVTSARATNAAAHPRSRYELDPAEQLELMRGLEADGDEVVGFYHSHPRGPPAPSDVDAREATWEGYSYVIVSLDRDPDVRSWRWTGAAFDRERVRIIDE